MIQSFDYAAFQAFAQPCKKSIKETQRSVSHPPCPLHTYFFSKHPCPHNIATPHILSGTKAYPPCSHRDLQCIATFSRVCIMCQQVFSFSVEKESCAGSGLFLKLDAPGSQLFARMDEIYIYNIRDQFLPTYIEIVHIWMKHPHGIVGRQYGSSSQYPLVIPCLSFIVVADAVFQAEEWLKKMIAFQVTPGR